VATNGSDIGRGVGHIFACAVDGHQAQPEAKRAAGLRRGNRMTDLLKQRHEWASTDLPPATAQRTIGGQGYLGVEPEAPQAARQRAKDPADRDGGKEMQGHHQPDRQHRRQAAFADFADPFLGKHLADGRLGNDLAEGVDGQGIAELASGLNLAYCESHAVAAVVKRSELALESMPQKPPCRLFAIVFDLGAYHQALGYLQRSYTLAQQLGSMIGHHAGAVLIQASLGLAEFSHAEDLIRQLAIPPQQAHADLQAAVHAVWPQGRQSIEWRIWSALAHVAPMVGMPAEAAHARQQAHTMVVAMVQDLRQSQHPAAAGLAEEFEQYALANLPAIPPAAVPRESAALALTACEQEVATLIAQGYSNRAIAAALVLSGAFAERHVVNIMAKLAVNSRAQIAA
jgi:DNA-binding CsgD family transcriptional regulator